MQKSNPILFILLIMPLLLAFVQLSFSDGQIITDTITSQALKGNKLGDPDIRNVTIYLPPDYASSDRFYSVIYLLHGFGGDERSFVDEVGEQFARFLLDGLIQEGMLKELIIVMPDANITLSIS